MAFWEDLDHWMEKRRKSFVFVQQWIGIVSWHTFEKGDYTLKHSKASKEDAAAAAPPVLCFHWRVAHSRFPHLWVTGGAKLELCWLQTGTGVDERVERVLRLHPPVSVH